MSYSLKISILQPQFPLEEKLLETPEFERGLLWGKPRPGHPEGKVLLHIQEVLQNLEQWRDSPKRFRQLRLIALAHDTFKYREEMLIRERRRIHHGQLAAEFLASWPVDRQILRVIQWHDEAYYAWRMAQIGLEQDAEQRIRQLHERLAGDWSLFKPFFIADTQTGDKDQAPLQWFASIWDRLIAKKSPADH